MKICFKNKIRHKKLLDLYHIAPDKRGGNSHNVFFLFNHKAYVVGTH